MHFVFALLQPLKEASQAAKTPLRNTFANQSQMFLRQLPKRDIRGNAEVGSDVYIADNYSVKKTMATDDMAVKLVAISPPSINSSSSSARLYFVEIK